jgi:prevent-host-death family protein
MTRSVNVAELRRGLSGYLKRVRRGEEILVRDRNLPIARIVPLADAGEHSQELLELAAEGIIRLSKKPFRIEEILSMPAPNIPLDKLLAALEADREDD